MPHYRNQTDPPAAQWLGSQKFQIFIGATIAVILLLCIGVALAALAITREGSSTISGRVDGSCSANGISNTIHCDKQGPSLANLTVQEGRNGGALWFDGPVEDLPPAAQFAGGSNCLDEDFMKWARSTERIYATDIEKEVVVTAGDPDLVTLTAADAVLLKLRPIETSQGTWIKCSFGGGGITYHHHVNIDTQSQTTWLSSGPGDGEATLSPRQKMPPASVSLEDRSEAIVRVTATSKPNWAYTGYVSLGTNVNGNSRALTIGDSKTPLRWAAISLQEGDEYYSISNEGKWVRNWTPGCQTTCTD